MYLSGSPAPGKTREIFIFGSFFQQLPLECSKKFSLVGDAVEGLVLWVPHVVHRIENPGAKDFFGETK